MPVPETADWKQKYRDSLVEMEAEEVRWRHVEQVLRRLVGRLCAAGMGVNPQLDDELIALAAANRRNADADELGRLAESLTTTVVAVDTACPVPTITFPATDTQTRLAVKSLLECLSAANPEDPAVPVLIAELAAVEERLRPRQGHRSRGGLVRDRSEQVQSERLQAAGVLEEVTKRLEEMATYLSDANHATRTHFEDTQTYNDTVMSQVSELSAEVAGATEFGVSFSPW